MCDELGEIEHKAYKIGIQLGISDDKMKKFEQDGNVLSTAVSHWLNGNTNVPVTWRSVVAALNSPFVGERGCAQKISKKYCGEEKESP